MDAVMILVWLLVFVIIAGVLVWVIDLIPNPPLSPVLLLLVVFLRRVGLV